MTSGLIVGCSEPDRDYVVKIGDVYLEAEEVEAALINMPPELDSLIARQQYIESWITNELLAQEARKHNLQAEPDVQQKIEASERSVLISEMTSRIEDQMPQVTEEEIKIYFDQNVDELRLRERYLWVRYISTTDSVKAQQAQEELSQLSQSNAPDSLWRSLIRSYAADTAKALVLSSNYFPQSRLFLNNPALRVALNQLNQGETAPVIRINNTYHVMQLVGLVVAGSKPQLAWYREEIRNLLRIQARRQLFTNRVAQLKNEAEASGHLVRGKQ
jgi:hypothetical protein